MWIIVSLLRICVVILISKWLIKAADKHVDSETTNQNAEKTERTNMWFVKCLLKTLLKLCVIILLLIRCVFFMFDRAIEERLHQSYSEETIDQLQGNLPTYFRKIREQLRACNLPDDLTSIDGENWSDISSYIEFKDSRIYIAATHFSDGREKIYIWYTKEYHKFKQLTDLNPPAQKELEIMCSFAESLLDKGEDAVHSETLALFLQEIFDKDEMSRLQAQLDNGEDIRINRHQYFEDDGVSWYVQLKSDDPEEVIVKIDCDIHFKNGDASEQE